MKIVQPLLAAVIALSAPGTPASAPPTSVAPAAEAAPSTSRVSLTNTGAQPNETSLEAAISADGRYVAFTSLASNLVTGDTNNRADVFVRDRTTNTTRRISVSSTGTQANGISYAPTISADGRYVAFTAEATATSLVPGDTNNREDIFLRDRTTNTTRRISVSSTGTQANNDSYSPSISANGRYITFVSNASNLVPGDTNNTSDTFLRDRTTNTTTRVSVSSTGAQASGYHAAISADGRYVAFESAATNLVPGDTNGELDIFLRDRTTNTTTRVSVSNTGAQARSFSHSPAISADGRYITFVSYAATLVSGDTNASPDILLRDRATNTTTRVSVSSTGAQANHYSFDPMISADGRYVAFESSASNLVPGDTNEQTDVFLRDRGQ